jgi:hypothetical protein
MSNHDLIGIPIISWSNNREIFSEKLLLGVQPPE